MKLTNSLNVKQLIETEWFEQFDSMQQTHIEEGLLQGLQVELYADPRFTAAQMQEIRRAMIQGVDVSSILNVRIGARKMKILADAMKCGVDILPVLSPKITCQMTKQYIASMKLMKKLDTFNKYSTKKLIIKFENE